MFSQAFSYYVTKVVVVFKSFDLGNLAQFLKSRIVKFVNMADMRIDQSCIRKRLDVSKPMSNSVSWSAIALS